MGKSHKIARAGPPHQRLHQASSPASPGHPLLSLQQQVGNRAVTAALRSAGGEPRSLLLLPARTGHRTAIATVQRADGGQLTGAAPSRAQVADEGALSRAPAEEAVGATVEDEITRRVSELPALEDIPWTENDVQDAVNEAHTVRSEVDDLGVGGGGALAEWSRRELAESAEVDWSVIQELQGTRAEVAPSPSVKPGRTALATGALSRAGRSIAGGASWLGGQAAGGASWLGRQAGAGASWLGGKIAAGAGATWAAIKSEKDKLRTPEGRRDEGGRSQAVAGLAAPVAGHAQQVIDNPVTAGAARLVGPSAAEQVHQAGTSVSATTTTLEHPAEFGRSFTSGGVEALHAVASVVGIFFSALKAALDVRSLVSSIRVYRALKEARESALIDGSNPAVIEAVEYAIKQKYEKIFKRAFGTAVALAAFGAALAVLIANPVGASLAAVIIGGIGAGMFLYKMGRMAWKKWGTKNLGEKRMAMAQHLYNQMRSRDVLALEAVRSLHLKPETVERAGATNGPKLIFRKLKSA